jgi:hypothetical protein
LKKLFLTTVSTKTYTTLLVVVDLLDQNLLASHDENEDKDVGQMLLFLYMASNYRVEIILCGSGGDKRLTSEHENFLKSCRRRVEAGARCHYRAQTAPVHQI